MVGKWLLNGLIAIALTLGLLFTPAFTSTVSAGNEFDLEGTVTDIVPYTDWTLVKVDGVKIVVNADTDVDGLLLIGAGVEIEGGFMDGKLVAEEIDVLDEAAELEGDFELEGTITKIVRILTPPRSMSMASSSSSPRTPTSMACWRLVLR